MFELNSIQIELIKKEVCKAGLTYSHLQEELIDHVCCDVENEMQAGYTFEKACEKVKQRIGYEGLQKIQENTLYLIDKQYRIMKNTMKNSGLIAPVLLALGAVFKIQHLVGASILLTLGFFTLCFIFLPSAILVCYKELSNRKRIITHILGFLGAFFGSLTFLFKIQHWPGAYWMQIIALVSISFLFLPLFFWQLIRNTEIKALKFSYILGMLGAIFYSAGFSFKILAFPGGSILLTAGVIFLIVIAFPVFVYNYYKNRETVSSRFVFLTFVVIWGVIPSMLLFLNVSENVLEYLNQKEMVFEKNESILENNNNSLYLKLENSKELSTGAILKGRKIHEAAFLINREINSVIESVKNDSCLDVGKTKVINEKFNHYKDSLVSFLGNNSCTSIINTVLQLESDDEFSWDKPREHCNLYTSRLVLLSVRLKVNKAEFIALTSILKK